MKIIFFGTPDFAIAPLQNLIDDKEITITGVITQPDRAIGRKQIMHKPPVKKIAEKYGIKVFQAENKIELEKIVEKLDADFFIVIAYGMILTKKVLNKAKYGAINVHGSILPQYRGASPIHQSLLNGDKETGVTIMQMDEKLDHGNIYKIAKIKILDEDNINTLSKKLSTLSVKTLNRTLKKIKNGEINSSKQKHSQASYCKKITKNDGEINWNKSAKEIINMIKAYTPWPSAFTTFHNKKLKILKAKIDQNETLKTLETKIDQNEKENINPEKLKVGEFKLINKTLKIGTKTENIIPIKVQLEGKKEANIKDFINGNINKFK